jgi:D-3-phosphoglycerate dehydrogenase
VIIIHRNVPGVLATINGVFGDHKVNVEAQLLGTRGEYGYVVSDLGAPATPDAVAELEALPETVRLRLL